MTPLTGQRPGPLARIALALTAWSERWVPDAFIFALIASAVVVVAGVGATEATFAQVIDAWGRGFWDLIPFTLQMALVIITGHVLATSRPMRRVIRAVSGWPTSPRGAITLVAAFALVSSWFNWVVAAYDLGEALANLVQPFWMLPILGLFHLRARDVMGFTFLVFVVLFPVVILLVTLLGMTLHYPLRSGRRVLVKFVFADEKGAKQRPGLIVSTVRPILA